MKPHSDNIIFFDTEFTSLDPYKGEIISIGLVKPSGEELYLEVEHQGYVNPWVKDNVVPLLEGKPLPRERVAREVNKFAGETMPFLVSYVVEFDAPYLYKLLGVTDEQTNKSLPYHWVVIDFASLLFGMGRSPDSLSGSKKSALLAELGIDRSAYREHHALEDAKLLRDIYLKLFGS
ncbi:MAG: 3'-5' exonuclease [bacterium]|nr:3'-5' exonuclease [bacterium]